MTTTNYLLSDSQSELERLRLQSKVWEPDAVALFDHLPLAGGEHAIDIGCGAMGVLRALSRRVGPDGRVLGVELDQTLLAAARLFVEEEGLTNVELREANVFANDLPSGAFDIVHLRFMFAPLGRDTELIAAAMRLCKSSGVIVVQEPDASCWSLLPESAAFERLKATILAAFRRGGGDFDAGRRTLGILRDAGLVRTGLRAAVHGLEPGHPYLRVALQFATSLRARIVDSLMSAAELDALVAEVERELAGGKAGLTFAVTQVWGWKP